MNAGQIDDATWQIAQEKLFEQWSPEQISAHFRAVGQGCISHETVYQHIYVDKRMGSLFAVEEPALPEGAQEAVWHVRSVATSF